MPICDDCPTTTPPPVCPDPPDGSGCCLRIRYVCTDGVWVLDFAECIDNALCSPFIQICQDATWYYEAQNSCICFDVPDPLCEPPDCDCGTTTSTTTTTTTPPPTTTTTTSTTTTTTTTTTTPPPTTTTTTTTTTSTTTTPAPTTTTTTSTTTTTPPPAACPAASAPSGNSFDVNCTGTPNHVTQTFDDPISASAFPGSISPTCCYKADFNISGVLSDNTGGIAQSGQFYVAFYDTTGNTAGMWASGCGTGTFDSSYVVLNNTPGSFSLVKTFYICVSGQTVLAPAIHIEVTATNATGGGFARVIGSYTLTLTAMGQCPF